MAMDATRNHRGSMMAMSSQLDRGVTETSLETGATVTVAIAVVAMRNGPEVTVSSNKILSG